MGWLRRLLGGGGTERPAGDDGDPTGGGPVDDGELREGATPGATPGAIPGATPGTTPGTTPAPPAPATRAPDDELAREKALLLDEARRLDDDLIQRQLRYADRSWTPPAQGGSRRADDEDAKRESAT